MEFVSILGKNEFTLKQDEKEFLFAPQYFSDLNLDKIVEHIRGLRSEYDLKKYYYTLVDNKADICYRQEVLKDFYNEELLSAAQEFSYGLLRARTCGGYSEKTEHPIQAKRWKIDAADMYITAVTEFERALKRCMPSSKGLKLLSEYLTKKVSDESFAVFAKKTNEIMNKLLSLEFEIEIEQNSIKIKTQRNNKNYVNEVDKLLYGENGGHNGVKGMDGSFASPLTGALRISKIENRVIQVLMKENPEVFNELDEYNRRYGNFFDSLLVRVEEEMQFYISFVLFRREIDGHNHDFKFCTPVISGDDVGKFAVTGAYDIALACKNLEMGKGVVLNSLDYRDKERFLIITGPNQGGKTTLARAIGQIAYFSMLGLEAPADSVEIPMFNDIMTHFEVEESLETGAGKLKEELKRLKPMMESEHKRCFVVINELFTTAASYDAYMMGSHVIKHFIETGYYGIYVTHISELAKDVKTGKIASLVAGIGDDGKTRTYKIERSPAKGEGHAGTLVDKYRLNYEEISERLNAGRRGQN